MMNMNNTKYIIAMIAILGLFVARAQDGEGLFKSKCGICHQLGKDGTGPNLKGVQAKWGEAEESELLYEWVRNSADLIATGNSKMAAAVKDYSAAAMSNQDVSNEDIDAIFNYVDNYVAPEKGATPAGGGEKAEVVYVPNYQQNLTLFYALLILMGALILGIMIVSGSITRFVKSPYFKKKAGDKGNHPFINTVLLLIGFTALMSNTSFGFEMMGPGEAGEDMPWLKIENVDIYILIFINLVLLAVLVYLKRMFKVFIAMTKSEDEVELHTDEDVIKKVNSVLTGAVPIEEEHTILMHHEYDGIKELDNNLPPWWVWGFYATIVFAIIYMLNYHVFNTGDLQVEEYNKSMVQAEKEIAAYNKKMAMDVDESNVTLLTEKSALSTGKAIFQEHCVTCHSTHGEGLTGPNLTDKAWIYGFDIKDVFTSIKLGRPGGMPDHKSKLNPIQLQQVSSYVLSLPEKDGLEPAGDLIEE